MMEDKWKQNFKERFEDYQPDVPIPPMRPIEGRRRKGGRLWYLTVVPAASAILLVALLFTHDDTGYIAPSISIPEPISSIETHCNLQHIPQLSLNRSHVRRPYPNPDPTIAAFSGIEEKQTPTKHLISFQPEQADTPSHAFEELAQETPFPSFDAETNTAGRKRRPLVLQLSGTGSANVSSRSLLASTGIDKPLYLDTVTIVSVPIKIGISLRVPLWERASIETGLNYGVCSAERHSLGIPLKIDYSMIDSRQFEWYAAAGAELSYLLEEKDKLFALTASSGFGYKITQYASIYAEPGISWSLNRRQQNISYYQIHYHPLSFELSVGLRFLLN